MTSSNDGQDNAPAKLSPAEFLKAQGIEEFGTAVVFQGELVSEATEKTRLLEMRADGKARRRLALLNFIVKDLLVHVIGILIIAGLSLGSGLVLSNSEALEPDKEWARNTLSAVIGIVAGYVFGKGSSSKP